MTIIAIDGTFSSGKGTLAKKIGIHYNYAYLDTGKIYRATAAKAIANSINLEDGKACAKLAKTLTLNDLDNSELKSGPIGAAASKVAVHTEVRSALFTFQTNFAKNPPKGFVGAVLDGRDIGTVICPNADVKIYIDAKPEVRAERRHKELAGYGEGISYDEVLAQLTERDHRDMNRAQAPLKPADDAYLLDTTNLSIETAFKAVTAIIDAALKAVKG